MSRTRRLPTTEAATLTIQIPEGEFAYPPAGATTPTRTMPAERDSGYRSVHVNCSIREVRIGRSPLTVDDGEPGVLGIWLNGIYVSNLHLVLTRTPSGWLIQDPGSTNGTRMADRRVGPEPAALAFDAVGQCTLNLARTRIFVSLG